ncbi:SdpI/YhfL protein family protein [Kosakonia arachidis]|uniref:SdpI/YhfL protein family protein n=1 Tax=Kosakonia arachidis TaxID=551989 RepID=A0A1I6YAP7_9ENTR|nr:SdpI family protein [Kosakonia arachidis]SFT47548.1 SdpI/YhfL protein family protein [Kosakonia arachidis]
MNDTFISLSIGCLVLMALAIPLARQRIKPNRFYGVRTARTLHDEVVWYRANRVFGVAMLLCGAVFFLLSVLFGNWREASSPASSVVLFLIAVLVPTITARVTTKSGEAR